MNKYRPYFVVPGGNLDVGLRYKNALDLRCMKKKLKMYFRKYRRLICTKSRAIISLDTGEINE